MGATTFRVDTDDYATTDAGALRPDPDLLGAFWDAHAIPGGVYEVRIPKPRADGPLRWRKAALGYFCDRGAFVREVRRVTGADAPGVYITLNPADPALLARAANRLTTDGAPGTADADVPCLRRLLVDVDAARKSGISATDAECAAALAIRDSIRRFLQVELDWPAPVGVIESGNGGHLHYALDLPNDAESVALLRASLAALAALFDTDAAKVDATVFNPARITRVPGTVTAKGDSIPDRPWRLATGRFNPAPRVVPVDRLRALAAHAPAEPARSVPNGHGPMPNGRAWDIRDVLCESGIGYAEKPKPYATVYELDRCLTSSDHSDGAAIFEFPSGALGYRCLHDRCAGKGWADVRDLLTIPRHANGAGPAWTIGGRRVGNDGTAAGTRTENDGANSDEDSDGPAWEAPIPLTDYPRPDFPTAVLPPVLRDFVRALTRATQTPAALPAMMVLAAVATAAAKRVAVRVRDGWHEPTNLYLVTALDSGNRKSAVVRAVTDPLRQHERDEAARMKPEIAEAENRRTIAEEALKKAQRKAADTENPDYFRHREEADRLSRELVELVVPAVPRLLADDTTPERLANLMAANGGRMAVLSPEGGIFDVMPGRFSKDGKSPNLDLFLKGHAGDDLPVDRLGRPGEYLTAPALTFGLAVQPSVVHGLAARPGFRGRGLLARWAYALPESFVGRRQINPPPVPADVADAYAATMTALLKLSALATADGTPDAHDLDLSADAAARFLNYESALEPRLGPDGDLGHVADWGGKLAGLVARLAGIFHGAEYAASDTRPWEVEIAGKTVAAAITLAETFLIPHALAAFGEMGADPATEDARTVLHTLARWPEPTASRRDLHQRLRRRFPRPADLDAPLAILADHGYLRPLDPPDRSGQRGRKPSERFALNPLWCTQNPRKTRNGERNGHSEDCGDSVYGPAGGGAGNAGMGDSTDGEGEREQWTEIPFE